MFDGLTSDNPRARDIHLAVMGCKRIGLNECVTRKKPRFPHPGAEQTAITTTPIAPRPCPGLGQLDCLPAEIQREILMNLDLATISAMGGVNTYAKDLVRLVPNFDTIRKYAPTAFKGIVLSGCASLFSIQDLYNALITPGCKICGLFTAHIYLPTLTRCCFNCAQISPSMATITLEVAADLYALTAQQIKTSTPSFKINFRNYHTDDREWDLTLIDLVCKDLVESAGIEFHGGVAAMEDAVAINKAAATGGFYTTSNDSSRLRLQLTIPFPLLDLKSGKAEDGVYCLGCMFSFKRTWLCKSSVPEEVLEMAFKNKDRAYDEEGFKEHVENCQSAIKLWDESEESRWWWLEDEEEGLNWWEERVREAKIRMLKPSGIPEAFRFRVVKW